MVMQRSGRGAVVRPYRSHVARMFVSHADALGLDVGGLIADDVDLQLDDAATVELPFPALIALCDRVAELAGDPFAGLTVASALPPGSYGVVEYVVASSATVGDAVQMLAKFSALTSELARTEIVRDPAAGTVSFHHWIDHPLARDAVQINECALATYQRLGHVRLGFRPRFVAIHVMHDRPDRRRELEAHFAAPVVFGAPRNALVVDAALLARPMVQADPGLLEIVTERAERDLSRVNPGGGVAAAMTSAYRALLTSTPHCAQAHDVARELGLSVRSLNRRLAAEGTSFRAIEADVKRALANEHLADTEWPLDRIAAALGFATPSAFIRAYKRWTGNTPSRARS
jgi:AraC-like DNA-binding protein